ncbi:serine hydrolase domain-containing protein [Glaciibacter superstes]|uniref:serine hydrolase domain-containing protein n=1 Tax=Glaciibacter superstes TaxID=501023 RepID=UPI0003B709E7|nr:serine hydrolase domain-containing protein [Glaciibacter superstes]
MDRVRRGRQVLLGLAVAAVLTASGCTTGLPEASAPPSPVSASQPVAGSAAACVPNAQEVVAAKNTQSTKPMSAEQAAAYDKAAAAVFAQVQADAPAVIVGVRSPQGTWTKAYGVADLASGAAASVDMYQRIASVTKTFVATAVLQLAEQGNLSLDDPIDDYVPKVPNGSRITLRELFSMTSGLADYQDEPTLQAEWLADPEASWTTDQLLDAAWELPTKFPPGSDMFYSNTNYILLGLAIEQVTGKTLAEVIETQLLDPLHLSSTTLPTSSAYPTPHLNGYSTLPNALTGTAPVNKWADTTEWNPQLFGAAGAMTSTVDDLLTWGRVLGTGQGVLSASTQVQRLESFGTSNISADDFYGDGLTCKDGWLGHAGTFMGYNTNLVYHPGIDTTIVVEATGNDGSSTPPRLAVTQELTSALGAVAGEPPTPIVVSAEFQVQAPVPEL